MSVDTNSVPTISRVFDDGTLVELVYDPEKATTAFAVHRPDGSAAIEPSFLAPTGEQLVPYSAKNNLISTGCVLLPSDIGDFGDKGDLVVEIQAFLHRYVDLSPLFEEGAAHYVLLTWVYDAFSDLGYLRLRGEWGSGKTRALGDVRNCVVVDLAQVNGDEDVNPSVFWSPLVVLDHFEYKLGNAEAARTRLRLLFRAREIYV